MSMLRPVSEIIRRNLVSFENTDRRRQAEQYCGANKCTNVQTYKLCKRKKLQTYKMIMRYWDQEKFSSRKGSSKGKSQCFYKNQLEQKFLFISIG